MLCCDFTSCKHMPRLEEHDETLGPAKGGDCSSGAHSEQAASPCQDNLASGSRHTYLVYHDSLLWIHVLWPHEVSRLIRPNRDGAAVKGPQLAPDLLEGGAVAAVPSKPEARSWADQAVAAPQALPPVPAFPGAPVLQQHTPCFQCFLPSKVQGIVNCSIARYLPAAALRSLRWSMCPACALQQHLVAFQLPAH